MVRTRDVASRPQRSAFVTVSAGLVLALVASCEGGSSQVLGGDPAGGGDGGGSSPSVGDSSGSDSPDSPGSDGRASQDQTVGPANVKSSPLALGPGLIANEAEAGLAPLVLSSAPDGTSKVAWRSSGKVHITTVDGPGAGADVSVVGNDFSDFYATATGGILLLSRDAQGGGTLNCGDPGNLCGATPPNPPVPCSDEYLVGVEGAAEKWATKVTSSSAALPPYSTSRTGPTVFMIWWYAHHGRIASDGTGYAAYFGDAISVSEGGCINIHQGDRMKVVGLDGTPKGGGFDLGCSHSGYERILWDVRSMKYVTVCKTDNANRLAFAPTYTTIRGLDLWYSDFGDFVPDGSPSGGYWGVVSDIRPGQPTGASGLADVHLLHFSTGAADSDIIVGTGTGGNERAPHIARYGKNMLLLAWERSPEKGEISENDPKRELFVQARALSDGAAIGAPYKIAGRSNRFESMVSYPDGSVGLIVKNMDGSLALTRISPR